MSGQNLIETAAKLYELRDRARTLLGDRYKPHMTELGKILQATADRDGKSVITVAQEVCTKRDLIGMDMLMVMAAAVELVEPTQ